MYTLGSFFLRLVSLCNLVSFTRYVVTRFDLSIRAVGPQMLRYSETSLLLTNYVSVYRIKRAVTAKNRLISGFSCYRMKRLLPNWMSKAEPSVKNITSKSKGSEGTRRLRLFKISITWINFQPTTI